MFLRPHLSPTNLTDNSRAALVTNKFLEAHCSPESVLPTSTWLSCPTDPNTARTWFLSLWNLTIAPHILDSVREGLQLYGRRARWVLFNKKNYYSLRFCLKISQTQNQRNQQLHFSWEDPVDWLLETWPWPAYPRWLKRERIVFQTKS